MEEKAESRGRARQVQSEGDAPTIGVDDAYAHSEQETEEEAGVPIAVAKDNKKKTIVAKAAPSNDFVDYAAQVAKKKEERLGHR